MTLDQIILEALKEDIGSGDHTSLACLTEDKKGKAKLIIKEAGIIAGVEVAGNVFKSVDATLKMDVFFPDGATVCHGDIAFIVEGSSRSILSAERLVLNFMQRMSGIATATNKLVRSISGTKARILDTRKTTPLLREIEKMAVKIGGGENHRFGLYDMILIKDNHIDYAGGVEKAIDAALEYLKIHKMSLAIEVEARSLDDVNIILNRGGVQRIMLDNFTPGMLKRAVDLIAGRIETEASGGIDSNNIRAYAETGVDFISVGAVTHHISSLDMSLKAC